MKTPAKNRPRPLHVTLLAAVLVAFASVASTAAAQIDDRARELLAGLQPTTVETIETLDQTTVMTLDAQGGTEVRSRTVIDYAGRRARIDTEVAPGMSATIVVADGQMQMVVNGMTVPLPPEMGEQFGDVFAGDPNDPLAGVESASFDGAVAYADVVSGDQVTVRGDARVAGLDQGEATRFVFDEAGGLLAVVTESSEGTMAMVFDEPLTGSPAVGRSAVLYRLQGSDAERFATIRYEDVRINEPLADDLF